ncbi:hypothetical protein F8M41_007129 [Gigaspora margarita]|uniref:Uncharacterized protein n=1 Tax=Gigaspora margarita TaxID=4874 RepID=A0A8H4A5J8_GIGMA|nr:hypothetical protein F8M41_007129 [Gigaspora margarita]
MAKIYIAIIIFLLFNIFVNSAVPPKATNPYNPTCHYNDTTATCYGMCVTGGECMVNKEAPKKCKCVDLQPIPNPGPKPEPKPNPKPKPKPTPIEPIPVIPNPCC